MRYKNKQVVDIIYNGIKYSTIIKESTINHYKVIIMGAYRTPKKNESALEIGETYVLGINYFHSVSLQNRKATSIERELYL